MRQGRLLIVLGCVALLAGCGGKDTTAQAPAQPARGTAKGRFFVCIVDVSASMKQNDRHHYAEQGAQLAVALLSESTHFGAVAFSSGAWVQADLAKVGAAEGRRAAQSRVSGIPRQGSTNFVGALATARRLITSTMAPEAIGAVVFLTDGEPTVGGKLNQVTDEVAFYASQQWPIYTIGLSDKADIALLKQMAAKTGGAHFSVAKAEDLLAAFVDIVSITEGLFAKRGAFGTVTVMPDTKRLVYVIAKAKPDATITDVTYKGGTPESAGIHRFPRKGGGHQAVEVLALDRPAAGTWRADSHGDVAEWFTLQQPPFTLELVAEQPRAKYVAGQAVHLALLARAEKKETLAEVREHTTVKGKVTSGVGDEVVDELELPVEGEERVPDPLVYHGVTTAKLVQEDKAEVLTAHLVCELVWGEQEVWTHKKIVSFEVVPPTGLFAVQPMELDVGALWNDSEPAGLAISVLSHQEQALFHMASNLEALSFEPKILEAGAGQEQEVVIRFDASKIETPGEVSGELSVSLDIGDVSGRQWTENVKVSARVVKLEGGDVQLPDTKPGTSVSHLLPHRAEPESELVFALSPLVHATLGPDGLPALARPAPAPAEETPAAEGSGGEGAGEEGAAGKPAADEAASGEAGGAEAPVENLPPGGGTPTPAPEKPVELVEKEQAKLMLELVETDAGRTIRGDVPMGAPGGVYVGTLTVSIPEGSQPARPSTKPAVPPPKVLKVVMSVGHLKPKLEILQLVADEETPLSEIALSATKRGWAEARILFLLKHVEKAELSVGVNDLTGPLGARISKPFLIQALPQHEWNGTTLLGGEKHELLYRVFATSDLVQGEYAGEMPVTVTRAGETAVELTLPIKVNVNLGVE